MHVYLTTNRNMFERCEVHAVEPVMGQLSAIREIRGTIPATDEIFFGLAHTKDLNGSDYFPACIWHEREYTTNSQHSLGQRGNKAHILERGSTVVFLLQ